MDVDTAPVNGNSNAEGILKDFTASKRTVTEQEKHQADAAIAECEAARLKEIETVDRGTAMLEERRQLIKEIHSKSNKNFLLKLELEQALYSREQLEKLLAACSGFSQKVQAFQHLCAEDRDQLNQSLPSIVADSVELQNNLSKEHKPMNEAIIAAIQANIKLVQNMISKTCAEFFIKRTEEVQKLAKREEEAKAQVRSLKSKLREKQKQKPKPAARLSFPVTLSQSATGGGDLFDSVVGSQAGKRRRDDDETSEAESSRGRSRASLATADEEEPPRTWTCEGCNRTFSDHDLFAYHIFRSCTEFDVFLQRKGLNPDDKEIDCPYCGDFFSNYTAIIEHKSDVHSSISGHVPKTTKGRGSQGGKRSKRH